MKDIIEVALTYPYTAPPYSYLYHYGHICPMIGDWKQLLVSRYPVIAYGSNRAPRQLWRKFGDQAIIPVTKARLSGFDIVYSAHFAGYGAIPATIIPSQGTVCDVFLIWLNQAQLWRMHESESLGRHYGYGLFAFAGATETISAPLSENDPLFEFGPQSELICDITGPLSEVGCYYSLKGCLSHQKKPIALAQIRAKGRPYPQMTQEAVLDHARQQISANLALPDFIEQIIQDKPFREQAVAEMQKFSHHPQPFTFASGPD